MSTFNRGQLRPEYPAFAERGYSPDWNPFGPPDLWPSGDGPGYSVYAAPHGRNLAGVDDMNAEGIETYPNELDLLAEADDVRGNGLFDPNGSHGNVHPNEGVFADHQSLPGYIDRDHFYTPSEVEDLPGGGQVMYVPGGAVSFQQGQPETLRQNQLLWELPPSVRPFAPDPLPMESTVLAPTAERGIQGLGFLPEMTTKNMVIAGVLGIAVGVGFHYWRKR